MAATAGPTAEEELLTCIGIAGNGLFCRFACAKKQDDGLRFFARHGKRRHLGVRNSLRHVPDEVFVASAVPPVATRQVRRTAAPGVFAVATRTSFLKQHFARLSRLCSWMLA